MQIEAMLNLIEPGRIHARRAAVRKGFTVAALFIVWFPLLFAGAFGGAWLGAQLTEGKAWAAALGFIGTPFAWSALMYKISALALSQPRMAKIGYELSFREKVVEPLLRDAFPGFAIEPAGFISKEVFAASKVRAAWPDQYSGRALMRNDRFQVAAVTADQTMGVFGILLNQVASPETLSRIQDRMELLVKAGQKDSYVWLTTETREPFASSVLVANSAEDLQLDLDAYRKVVATLQEMAT